MQSIRTPLLAPVVQLKILGRFLQSKTKKVLWKKRAHASICLTITSLAFWSPAIPTPRFIKSSAGVGPCSQPFTDRMLAHAMFSFLLLLFTLFGRQDGLKITTTEAQIFNQLPSDSIGVLLHSIDDLDALQGMLNDASVAMKPVQFPFYNYYVKGCTALTWPRIRKIMAAYDQDRVLPSQRFFALDALLSSSCLANWNGLWKSSTADLRELFTFAPHSNPIFAFGDLLDTKGLEKFTPITGKFQRNPHIVDLLLEMLSSAMLSDGLFAEDSLKRLLNCHVLSRRVLDPVRFPRLSTMKIVRLTLVNLQTELPRIEVQSHWTKLDRLIWALNYDWIVRTADLPVGEHPDHAVNKLYQSLYPRVRSKNSWRTFMREFLKPKSGILANVRSGCSLTRDQIYNMESMMRDADLLSKHLLLRWLDLNVTRRFAEYLRALPSSAALPLPWRPYSAFEVYNADEEGLFCYLKQNIVQTYKIPLFITQYWIINRRIYPCNDALIQFFDFSARLRLFRRHTLLHADDIFESKQEEDNLGWATAYFMAVFTRTTRQHATPVLEDVAGCLKDPILLHFQTLTASLVSGALSNAHPISLSALFYIFLKELFDPKRDLFTGTEIVTGTERVFLPRPWIRPRLWLLFGRFLTISFQRGISFPSLKLDRQFFLDAFNQSFMYKCSMKSEFIEFASLRCFEFNNKSRFPRIVSNCDDCELDKRALLFALIAEKDKDKDGYKQHLFDSRSPPLSFNKTTALGVDVLAIEAVQRGMFMFWLGLEPLTAFFTADEVYDAIFGSRGAL